MRDEQKSPHQLLREVRELRRELSDLKECENRFRTLVEMSPNLMLVICDGEVAYVNPVCEEMLGYSQDLFYTDDFGFLHVQDPATRHRIRASYARHMRGEEVEPYDVTFVRKDGGLIEGIMSTRIIPWNGSEAVLGVLTELTDRQKSDHDLASILRFKEEILKTAPIWIDTLDTEGNITSWNHAAEEISGYSAEEVMGHDRIWAWLYPDAEYRTSIVNTAMELIHSGNPREGFTTRILTKSGEERIISWYSVGITDMDGQSLGSVAFGIDITDEEHMRQRLLKYHEKVRSLASELSLAEERERQRIGQLLHDQVTQNLTACRLRLGSMQREGLPGEVEEGLGTVLDMLANAIERTDSLGFDLASPLLHQVGLADSLERQAEKILETHGIEWQLRGDGKEVSLAEETKVTIFRSARELLFNVLKHSGASHATIDITTDNRNLIVAVKDDGCGFNPSEVESRSSSRTGLGILSIRERLAYLGGHLEIQSAPNEGTTAILVTPLERGEGDEH